MSLELMKTYNIHSTCIQSIESVSEDLMLFNIEMQSNELNFEARPYHWRCDFGNVPPLDISIDSDIGLLKEITIFISKKTVAQNYSYACAYSTTVQGYPRFATNKWTKHEYYDDEFLDVSIFFEESNLIVILDGSVVSTKLIVNDELDILLDKENLFAGFIMKSLDYKALDLFHL